MTQPQYQPYRTIPLTQGQYALVDESDYEYLNQWGIIYLTTLAEKC